MMTSESTVERARKRIVEAYISGFKSAYEAIRHGRTIRERITDKVWGMKFSAEIAGVGLKVAITDSYIGPTVLKLTILEIRDQNTAVFVRNEVENTVNIHNEFYHDNLKVEQITVREKPQAQTISINYIPRTSRVHGV